MIDLETYLDAAAVTLRTSLSAGIDLENSRHNDFAIPKPLDIDGNFDATRVLVGGEKETDRILSYPAFIVAAPDGQRGNFALANQSWDQNVTVVVQAWIEQTDQMPDYETLYRGTLRMARVILLAMLADSAFGQHVSVGSVAETYRVDPRNDSRPTRAAWTTLTFTLMDQDTLG